MPRSLDKAANNQDLNKLFYDSVFSIPSRGFAAGNYMGMIEIPEAIRMALTRVDGILSHQLFAVIQCYHLRTTPEIFPAHKIDGTKQGYRNAPAECHRAVLAPSL